MDRRLGSAFTVAGLLFACGDSVPAAPGGNGGASNTSSGGYGANGGEGGEWSPTQPLNSVGSGGFPEPSCFDESKAVGLGPLIVKTGQDLCTPEIIAESFTACLDSAADEAICTAFTDANPGCAACLGLGGGEPTGIHPVVLQADKIKLINAVACHAAAQDKLRCAQEASDLQYCKVNACGGCDVASYEFGDCLQFTENHFCREVFPLTPDCYSLVATQFENVPECEGSDDASLYNNVASYLCGPAIVPPPP